jgi:hypothetical protein
MPSWLRNDVMSILSASCVPGGGRTTLSRSSDRKVVSTATADRYPYRLIDTPSGSVGHVTAACPGPGDHQPANRSPTAREGIINVDNQRESRTPWSKPAAASPSGTGQTRPVDQSRGTTGPPGRISAQSSTPTPASSSARFQPGLGAVNFGCRSLVSIGLPSTVPRSCWFYDSAESVGALSRGPVVSAGVPASTRSREYPCSDCGRHSATRRMRRSMGMLGKVSCSTLSMSTRR